MREGEMSLTIVDYPLNGGQYIADQTQKTHVVWHGTMGRTRDTPYNGEPGKATSSIDGWNNDPSRVGAPWLVDRDATVYKTFDDRYWIYHLGLRGTMGQHDRSSVGIELANELNLAKNGSKYYAFDKITPNTEYVGKVVATTWRGSKFFAALDDVQVDAAIALTLDVCERFGIEPSFLKPSQTYMHPACWTKATIICHSNCRRDKKDLYLEEWVLDKIFAAGIPIIDGNHP